MIIALFFVGAVAVLLGFQWVMTWAISDDGRAQPQRSVSYDLRGPAGVLDAVWGGVEAKDTPPAAVGSDTYRLDRSERRVRWAHGTRTSKSFTAVLRITSHGDLARATLAFAPPTEAKSEAEAAAASEAEGAMRALRHEVETALEPFLADRSPSSG